MCVHLLLLCACVFDVYYLCNEYARVLNVRT